MQDGTILSGDSRIYYQIEGRGEKEILFLHGNGENLHIFDMITRKLSPLYRICRMDSRCHGRSTGLPNTLTIDKMAEDVVCLIKTLGLNKLHLIGFSDGANIAIQVALGHSHLIDKLVLAGANLAPDGLLPKILFQLWTEERILKLKKKCGALVDRELALLALMTNQPSFTPEMLQNIQAKTLVIAGEQDMIRREHTYQIAKAIPEACLRIIPENDHFVFSRRLNRLLEVLLPFLKEDEE